MQIINQEMTRVMNGTNRLLCEGMLGRGWRIRTPYVPCPHLYVDRGDGRELHLFGATPPTISYAAAHLSNNKFATFVLLTAADIYQLECCSLKRDGLEEALGLMRKHGKVVVKPLDGSHGKGITVNVDTERGLSEAYERALQHNQSLKGVLVQQQFIATTIHDIRIVCIAKKFTAAIERIPARVWGDGLSTVRQLIEQENLKPERGEPYHNKLAVIDLPAAERYLGARSRTIPANGQEVVVLGVANYGAGGELKDVTDDVPEWMKIEAERAALVLDLDVAGVDYMIEEPLATSTDRATTEAVIVEVNKSPSLSIHDEPTYGISRDVTAKYIDFIATL